MTIAKHGISYPIASDNDMKPSKVFENRYWPRKYIADHEEYLTYDHIGEGEHKETEKIIQNLLEGRPTLLGIQTTPNQSLMNIRVRAFNV